MASDLLDRMRRNLAGDWRIEHVEAVCREHRLLFRAGKGTSHCHAKYPNVPELLTIPARRPFKPVYIRKLVRYRDLRRPTMKLEYTVRIERLAESDDGGYLAIVPDLPGCMSDGETPEEALRNVQEAIASWIEAAREWKQDIPKPSPPLARAG